MTLKSLSIAVLLASASATVPAQATLLVNGNFDSNLANWQLGFITNGSGNTVTNGFFFGGAAPSAQFRSGSNNFRTLSQSVATVVGRRYALTYSMIAQNSSFPSIVNITTGSLTTTLGQALPFGLTTFTQEFVADSELSLISFAVRHGGINGQFLFLDDVSLINVIPEPESWAMIIAGFGLVGAAARRRRHGRSTVA